MLENFMIDVRKLRKDFPIFKKMLDKKNLVYLDSAATSLKPKAVIDAVSGYYEEYTANIHRGVYSLAEKATEEYENARKIIRQFIGAERPEEIVFVRNATEAFNLVAASYAGNFLKEGEGILLTEMEHHANLVPWQQIAKQKKLNLFFIAFDPDSGELIWDKDNFPRFLKERKIKIVSLTHISNVLGTINPVKEIAEKAREAGCVTVVDAAQSVPHTKVDVKNLGADFLAFSGHKMLGPTGIGVLWGKHELFEKMPPFLTGGHMISDVNLEFSAFQDPPLKFEAGTPDIAGAIGLGAAIKYLQSVGMNKVHGHEKELIKYAWDKLSVIPRIKILGPQNPEKRSGVISFVIDGIHPHDIGSFLDEQGVMIRVGDHCAKPLHKKYRIPASSRISFYLYNDFEDIDRVMGALEKMVKIFKSDSNNSNYTLE